MVPVFIGCPPGKRLAFDITYTLQYNRLQNKHYFNCIHPDPEMPCFLFRDSACPGPSSALFTVLCPATSPSLPFLPACLPPHPLSALPLGTLSLFSPLTTLHFSGQANFFSWPHPLHTHSLLPLLLDPRFGDGRLWQF